MAMTAIKKSSLPVLRGGPGKIGVAVRANGQISFTSGATKALNSKKYAVVGFDEAKRTLQFQGVDKAPKGYAESDLFKIGQGKKSKTAFMSGAGLLTMLEYDYKKSGNQNFEATADETTSVVKFTLPKGSLTPLPVRKRTKKAKGANGASAGKVNEPELPTPEDTEPELEEAEEEEETDE